MKINLKTPKRQDLCELRHAPDNLLFDSRKFWIQREYQIRKKGGNYKSLVKGGGDWHFLGLTKINLLYSVPAETLLHLEVKVLRLLFSQELVAALI